MIRFNTDFFYYKPRFFYYLILVIFGGVLLIRSLYNLDPDLGWHLRLGQIILQNGIPKTDPLSYTMPNFPFVDHEWLNNIIFATLYNNWQLSALTLLFALLPVASLLITTPKKINFNFVLACALVAVIILQFAGIRTQVETWFFVCLLLKLIFSEKLWDRYKFYVPALFILWANLHGGFAIGLGLLFMAALLKSIQERSFNLSFSAIFLLSAAATLINPYGIRLWGEVLNQLTDINSLRTHIEEWSPIYTKFSPTVRFAFLIYLTSFMLLVIKFRKKFTLLELGIFSILLIMAINTRRNIPLWALSTLFLIPKLDINLKDPKLKFASAAIVLVIVVLQGKVVANASYTNTETFNYPSIALPFIKFHIKGEIFTSYNWGGYMDWMLPEKKVFIDGRMPSWRWRAPDGRSDNALADYERIISGKTCDYKDLFDKYDIQTVIRPTYNIPNNNTSNVVVGTDVDTKTAPIVVCLEKMGWKKIYSDYITEVYSK